MSHPQDTLEIDIEKAALLETAVEPSSGPGAARRPAIRVPLHIVAANHASLLRPTRPIIRYFLAGAIFFMSYWVLSSLHGGRFAHVIPGYVWEARAAEVRAAFQHAYHSYELLGFPHDEIKPISNDTSDQFNGWGVTALDSLDTMIIMGLDEELQRALKHLEKLDFFSHDKSVPFFETVIRYLGGLLSTWHLTKLPLTLKQADNLGLALLPAFNTSIQFPSYSVNPVTKEVDGAWSGHANFGLAESASCQMEYKYLAKLTGRTEFFDAAQNVMDGLLEMQDPDTQMWSQWISDEGSKPVAKARPQFSVGAGGDSAYEYLLKQYLLSGKSEPQMLEMYLSSIRGVITNLLYVSKQRNLLYVTDIAYSKPDRASKILVPVPSGDLEHLSCFLPGLLALGAHTLRDIPENVFPAEERKLHLDIAKGLATTCYLVYADSFTGLAPD
ncbi:glycoside hydrolase family 47 protein, partial [Tulasnella calospora MUT 4182]